MEVTGSATNHVGTGAFARPPSEARLLCTTLAGRESATKQNGRPHPLR